MLDKICPKCGCEMELFDHDDEDGNFAGWEWMCINCDYREKEQEEK